MSESARLSRRYLLRAIALAGGSLALGGLLQACGSSAPAAPTAAPVPAVTTAATQQAAAPTAGSATVAAPADWQQQMDVAQAGAQQEGKVSIIVPPGDIYRTWVNGFQSKYGVEVELMSGNGSSEISPKIDAERKAGQSNWDLLVHSPGSQFAGLKTLGVMDELRPHIVVPEVLDDSRWFQGFQSGWIDLQQTTCYAFVADVNFTAWVNRAYAPESQLSTLEQLWDPEWVGKIAMYDPRIGGAGEGVATVWYLTLGPDQVRTFLQVQQPALTQDRRQMGEWIVQGEYPIGIGLSPDSLSPFSTQGVDISQVVPLDPHNTKGIFLTFAAGTIGLLTQAPHPNAAKLFANWALTQEAQASWSTLTFSDSRRLDVPPADLQGQPDPSINYVTVDTEKNYGLREQASELAKSVLS